MEHEPGNPPQIVQTVSSTALAQLGALRTTLEAQRPSTSDVLALVATLEETLARLTGAEEVKAIMDGAAMIETWLEKRRVHFVAANAATILRLRAERKLSQDGDFVQLAREIEVLDFLQHFPRVMDTVEGVILAVLVRRRSRSAGEKSGLLVPATRPSDAENAPRVREKEPGLNEHRGVAPFHEPEKTTRPRQLRPSPRPEYNDRHRRRGLSRGSRRPAKRPSRGRAR